MSRRGLYTIAPHGRFLPLLVEGVLDGTLLNGWERSGPFWLSDVTIILPTRRARLTLAELFAQRLGGATLLPDIRTFGGDVSEEEPFLPPIDAPMPAPAAGLLERRLVLSRLVHAFARSADGFASPPNAAEIFWLADSLGQLIDDFTIEGVSLARLGDLVPDELSETEVSWLTTVDYVDRLALVVLVGEDLVAVGRYDRVPASESAEVAFLVADDYQHRGLGMLLLQNLATAARRQGITTFLAETQASNRDMMGVFEGSGYEVTSSLDAEIISVSFRIAPYDAADSGESVSEPE